MILLLKTIKVGVYDPEVGNQLKGKNQGYLYQILDHKRPGSVVTWCFKEVKLI